MFAMLNKSNFPFFIKKCHLELYINWKVKQLKRISHKFEDDN